MPPPALDPKKNLSIKFPYRLGIIDLGTNSIRFDIYEIDAAHHVNRIHREKQMIRLGDGVFEKGSLKNDAMERALDTIEDIGEWIRQFHVDHTVAFATSALRDADNKEAFIRKIEKRFGILLTVITGLEEASLIAKGILNNEKTPTGLYGLVDIGGGSTEVNICFKKTLIDSFSFDLGANRLQQVFLKTVPPKGEKGADPVGNLREHIRQTILPLMHGRSWPMLPLLIGSSGTIRAFKRIIKKNTPLYSSFEKKHLSEIVAKMSVMTKDELAKIRGMDAKRVDLILAGGILLEEIMDAFGATTMMTTEFSLRDGILDEEMERLWVSVGHL